MVSLNNLTDQSQFLTTGTSGTDFTIASTGDTHTFNIPSASASNRGLITTGSQTIAGSKTFSSAIIGDAGVLLKNGFTTYSNGYTSLGGDIGNLIISSSIGGTPYDNEFSFTSSTSNTYTFPNASGTLALTSNLSSYVPYTGATSNVTLGVNNLSGGVLTASTSLITTTTALSSYGLQINNNSSNPAFVAYLNSDNSMQLSIANASNTTIVLASNNTNSYINTTGNFGLGNNNPSFRLDVTGTGRFTSTLTASSLIKSGGTSSQFLKADGSVDSTAYLPLSGGTMTGNIMLRENVPSGTIYYIGQLMANTDTWKIYGGAIADNQGELIFELGDDAQPISTGGQRFNFFFNASTQGTSKSVLLIDYNEATFNANLTATSFIKSGGTSSQFLKANGSVDSTSYLPLSGGTLTGSLSGTSATFSGVITGQTNGNTFGTASSSGRAVIIQSGSSNQSILFKNSSGGDGTLFINGTSTSIDYNFNTYSVGDALVIKNNGFIGIGTSNPSGSLEIAKAGGLFLRLNNTANSADVYIQYDVVGSSFSIGVNGNGWFSYTSQAKTYDWWTSNAIKMSLNSSGNLSITGALSKGSGSFKIDHPLESMSETHNLVHSFVEAPQADLYYRGKLTLINGKGQANIDQVATMTEGTFELLCREIQCFTTNETGWDLVKGKVIGNIIYIESQNQNSTDEISWLVIGERQDKHMMDTQWTDENGRVIVEPLKEVKKEQPIPEQEVSIVEQTTEESI